MDNKAFTHSRATFVLALATPMFVAACSDSGGGSMVNGSAAKLTAQCVPQGTTVPDGAWVCPDARTVECSGGGADVDTIYVNENDQLSCATDGVSVSEAGPFGVGTYTIAVRGGEGQDVCTSQLTVRDTQAPVVTAHTTFLWPPNHKLHGISVSDCVSAVDGCDGDVQGEFIWASSDEPVDDLGDGHFAPDILFDDCQHVSVRAERQGPKEGRVYKLGVRVFDGAGHSVESECQIIVDHDQRGVDGADSGEAYRITLDGTAGNLSCGDAPSDDDDAGEPGTTAGTGAAAGTGATAGTGGAAGEGAGEAGQGGAGVIAADGGTPF